MENCIKPRKIVKSSGRIIVNYENAPGVIKCPGKNPKKYGKIRKIQKWLEKQKNTFENYKNAPKG